MTFTQSLKDRWSLNTLRQRFPIAKMFLLAVMHKGFWKIDHKFYFALCGLSKWYSKENNFNLFFKVLGWCNFWSSRLEVFCKKGVLSDFPKFTGKHLCQRLFFLTTLLKKVSGKGVFLWILRNFYKHLFYRTPLVAAFVIYTVTFWNRRNIGRIFIYQMNNKLPLYIMHLSVNLDVVGVEKSMMAKRLEL